MVSLRPNYYRASLLTTQGADVLLILSIQDRISKGRAHCPPFAMIFVSTIQG